MNASTHANRDARDVLDHHLEAFASGVDELMKDYANGSVLITPSSTFEGLDAIKGFFETFIRSATPEFWSSFKVLNTVVTGKVAYLTWEAKPAYPFASDTFVVEDGKITVQTFASQT